jgi:AmpD protein
MQCTVGTSGVASCATQIPSPNCDARPARTVISLIVVHGISLPPGRFGGDDVSKLFTNALDPAADPYYPGIAHLRVSSHFFIRRDGTLVQFVPCRKRVACRLPVARRPACNDYSVGIELEGTDDLVYAAPQYAMLARVAKALCARYPIRDMVGPVMSRRDARPIPPASTGRDKPLLGAAPTSGRAAG